MLQERGELVFGNVEFGGDLGSSGTALELGLQASPGVADP